LVHQQTIQTWQGPFPPPAAVREYEQILPGTWDRLLKMAEQAQAAQIATTNTAQEFARRDVKRGHWLGFVTTMAAMAGAILCALYGHGGVAGVFLSVPVMAVAKALIETARAPTTPIQMAAPVSKNHGAPEGASPNEPT
jgi:uncharacterized membrane protein